MTNRRNLCVNLKNKYFSIKIMDKRTFIKQVTLLGTSALVANPIFDAAAQTFAESKIFTLPTLAYNYDALEPFIDKMTMEIHHSKHHQAYVNNLNAALAPLIGVEKENLDTIIQKISSYPIAVRNNGGGHFNHSFFWKTLTPKALAKPSGKLATAIDNQFGSFDNFKASFSKAALSRFGSGWAWLIMKDKGLEIVSTPNQDNPLMDIAETKGTPLLALDVWEHAYYLKYQNKRADYIDAFWKIADWKTVEQRFEATKK
jgi:superoxide dismutase, Fe-Mn family